MAGESSLHTIALPGQRVRTGDVPLRINQFGHADADAQQFQIALSGFCFQLFGKGKRIVQYCLSPSPRQRGDGPPGENRPGRKGYQSGRDLSATHIQADRAGRGIRVLCH